MKRNYRIHLKGRRGAQIDPLIRNNTELCLLLLFVLKRQVTKVFSHPNQRYQESLCAALLLGW